MSQNAMRQQWTFNEVDNRLKGIMENIFTQISQAAASYGAADDYALGANIAGFLKVAQAMMAQGAV